MIRKLKHGSVELVIGNIVDQRTDAIVNAANTKLAGDDSNTIEITYRVKGDPEFRGYFVTLRDWVIAEVCMAE